MDSRHSVLSATGALSPDCDRVDSGPVFRGAVEGGLEKGEGNGSETEGDGKGGELTETKGLIIL